MAMLDHPPEFKVGERWRISLSMAILDRGDHSTVLAVYDVRIDKVHKKEVRSLAAGLLTGRSTASTQLECTVLGYTESGEEISTFKLVLWQSRILEATKLKA